MDITNMNGKKISPLLHLCMEANWHEQNKMVFLFFHPSKWAPIHYKTRKLWIQPFDMCLLHFLKEFLNLVLKEKHKYFRTKMTFYQRNTIYLNKILKETDHFCDYSNWASQLKSNQIAYKESNTETILISTIHI